MTDKFDLIVIGSGPGGYVAAIRAAQLGLKVACVEKTEKLGGTCLNIGCIPSKALLYSSEKYDDLKKHSKEHGIEIEKINLDLIQLMQRKDKIVNQLTSGISFLFKKNKVKSIIGEASFIDKNTILIKSPEEEKKIVAKNIIIATGSISADIPNIKIDEKKIVTSTGALSLSKVPENMLIIGGGYIGLEMGSVWSRLGSNITVVEALDKIVSTMDQEISSYFLKSLQKQNISFKLSHKVVSAISSKDYVEVVVESINEKKQNSQKYEVVLVSIGRKPNIQGLNLKNVGVKFNNKNFIEINKNFQTNLENIYAIGDVVRGPMLAHKAEEEGIACAEIIVGQKPHIVYDFIPAIVYTKPEIASVGKTEEELKKSNIDYKVGKFPFAANGRAKTMSSDEGFVKILVDKKNDTILGAHIIGNEAGSLIAEIVTTMEFGGSAEDIARICHAHPTTSEAIKEAAFAVEGRTIHI